MIDLQNVCVTYGGERTALSDVTLHIEAGEFVFVVGPTGAGKSTLLKLLYREEVASAGTVTIDRTDVARMRRREVPFLRRRMGVVFQDFSLLPNKTLFENVAFALRVIGAGHQEIRSRVPAALRAVCMEHRCDAFPGEVSGGELQRVAIARALVNDPPLLVADEPTGNLDPDTSMDIAQILQDINRRGTTVVVATHDQQIVDCAGRRVVEFQSGRLVRDETPGRYERLLRAEALVQA